MRPILTTFFGLCLLLTIGSTAGAQQPRKPVDSAKVDLQSAPRVKVDRQGNVTRTAGKKPDTAKAAPGIPHPVGKKVEHPDTVTTVSGLKYVDMMIGEGDSAATGLMAQVHYTGWVSEKGKRGKKFDSSVDKQSPLAFLLGRGLVIKGWDEGIVGMRPGGKRTLILSPGLAYGMNGFRDMVPPNATVIYDVDLLSVFPPGKFNSSAGK